MAGNDGAFYNLRLTIPAGARDESQYRYLLPAAEIAPAADVRMRMQPAPQAIKGPRFRPSLLVTRHPAASIEDIQQLFDRDNSRFKERDPKLTVLQHGTKAIQGRTMLWQDRTFTGPAGFMLFQRHLSFLDIEKTGVTIVITSDKNDLDQVTAQLGLST